MFNIYIDGEYVRTVKASADLEANSHLRSAVQSAEQHNDVIQMGCVTVCPSYLDKNIITPYATLAHYSPFDDTREHHESFAK